jgi:hypothetical protein
MRKVLIASCFLALACREQQTSMIESHFESEDVKWSSRTLSVCFEPESASRRDLDTLKGTLRDTVVSEYSRAGFSFTGWTSCNQVAAANIRILVAPELTTRVITFGRTLDNLRNGVQLAFDFQPGSVCEQDTHVVNCIKNYGLHEFGHALGQVHEADRSDSTCNDKTGGSDGITKGGYDPDSIMDYCNNERFMRGNLTPTLSAMDVQGLLSFYGSSRPAPQPVATSSTSKPSSSTARWSDPNSGETFPYCTSAASDPDKDGWGWENNTSCKVKQGATPPAPAPSAPTPASPAPAPQSAPTSSPAPSAGQWVDPYNGKTFPYCGSAASDPDKDGWGWENNASCKVRQGARPPAPAASTPTPASPAPARQPANTSSPVLSAGQWRDPYSGQTFPYCASAASDPDGDGWGWENSASCKVRQGSRPPAPAASTPTPASPAPAPQPANTSSPVLSAGQWVDPYNGRAFPYCASAASDPDGDGWGWENNASCKVR